MAVDDWLDLGQVRSTIAWRGEQPELDDRSVGLFGAIGVQLVLAIAGRGLAVCGNCGRGFVPNKKPNPNRRTWCDRPASKRAGHAANQRVSAARRRSSQHG